MQCIILMFDNPYYSIFICVGFLDGIINKICVD